MNTIPNPSPLFIPKSFHLKNFIHIVPADMVIGFLEINFKNHTFYTLVFFEQDMNFSFDIRRDTKIFDIIRYKNVQRKQTPGRSENEHKIKRYKRITSL